MRGPRARARRSEAYAKRLRVEREEGGELEVDLDV